MDTDSTNAVQQHVFGRTVQRQKATAAAEVQRGEGQTRDEVVETFDSQTWGSIFARCRLVPVAERHEHERHLVV